jgi:hypothetical protein
MTLAQLGPLTTLSEAGATAVGAGVVLGSVGAGAIGLAAGFSREQLELRALQGGYAGGVAGALFALCDLLFALWLAK